MGLDRGSQGHRQCWGLQQEGILIWTQELNLCLTLIRSGAACEGAEMDILPEMF